MIKPLLLSVSFCGASLLASTAFAGAGMPEEIRVDQDLVVEQVSQWPEERQQTANELIERYGQPAIVTEMSMIWYDTAPFKRTVLYRDAVEHNFPVPHSDFLEQTIDYAVPADKMDDLAELSGSIIVDRTRGELSVRCHMESANFLSINLAHQVVSETLSVEQARQAYADAIQATERGEDLLIMRELLFPLPDLSTADPGISVIDQELGQDEEPVDAEQGEEPVADEPVDTEQGEQQN